MALTSGTRLGPYEIVSPLGAGGMGEVYRAFDTTLRRTVALKILATSDDEAGARLLQEARAASALNHPHVCTVYEVGSHDGQSFIVMELVEGRPLSDLIASKGLNNESVLRYGVQIADALAHAHENGIIHRDLKSQNVVVTPGGRAKVLDFGVAGRLPESDARVVTKTWEGDALSRPGMLVGTLAYMAPEVLRGEAATVRSDIWALGVLLYEMASGKLPFDGRSSVDLIAAIVGQSAAPLPPVVSSGFRSIVQRCLAKDASQRYGSAAEARAALEAVQIEVSVPATSPSVMPRSSWSRGMIAAAAITTLLAIAIATWSLFKDGGGAVDRQTTRTVISLAADTNLAIGGRSAAVAISPDGRRVAYVGRTGHDSQVYLRSLDHLETTAVDGTRGSSVAMPFFSADGEWLGFSIEGQLMKVAVRGGTPVPIAMGRFLGGASWAPDGDIVVPGRAESLMRIPAAGGEPQTLSAPNREQRERSHRFAEVLPGGKAVLFIVGTTMIESWDDASIAVLSLETGEHRVVLAGGSNPHYSRSGHLVYARAGNIMAAPFDLAALQVTGPPVVAVRGVATSSNTGEAEFSLSQNGSLVYAPGRAWGADRRLVWVDRSGHTEPLLDRQGAWEEPRVSPDGRRLTLDADTVVSHVWIADLTRGSIARLTNDGNNNGQPLWAPDSNHVAFLRDPPGGDRSDAVLQIADGSQPATRLTTSGPGQFGPGGWLPRSFSRDGKLLALDTRHAQTGWDTFLLSLDGARAPEPFLQTEANEYHASFSPDGRWVAYQSDVSGKPEIYVSPVRGAFRKWQVSTEGGRQPVWNANGKELVYLNQDQIMAVDVEAGQTVAFGKPTMLFKRLFPNSGDLVRDFDLSPDGRRFAVVDYSTAMLPPSELILVQHWDEELKRLVPTGR
jgi:eukaryotic-like serine/threonine-protein kinase